MLNIFKKNETSFPMLQSWDPIQGMRSFLNRSPFSALRNAADFNPAFEVKESREGYMFKADVPGVKESDLEIHVQGPRLLISGRRHREHHEANDTVHTWERGYGSFQRVFALPPGVDPNQARAELTEGVLTVTLPRADETELRKISVTGSRV